MMQPIDYANAGYSFNDEEMSYVLTPDEKTMTLHVKFWYGSQNAQCFNGGEFTVPMIEITRKGFEGIWVGTWRTSIADITANGDHPDNWTDERLKKETWGGDLSDVINMDPEFIPAWIIDNRGNPFGWTTIDDDNKTCTTRYYA